MDDEAERRPAEEEEQDEQQEAAPERSEVAALNGSAVRPHAEDKPDNHQHPKE